MTLTVDASIVAKWFLTEPQSEEARRLLAPRIRLHAPDVLLVEYANVIWKKVHRREIADAQPYLEGLASLPQAVTLHRSVDLLDHAVRIAMEMDHPVYDCLYLTCADATASALITADHRFATKAAGTGSVQVWALGSPGVADRIEMAATAPIIGGDKVGELIEVYEFFARTERQVVAHIDGRTEGLTFLTPADADLFLNSPSYRRLINMVSDLSEEERVDLLALGWLGAGHFDADWHRNLEHAYKMAASVENHYVAGYGQHWQAGHERLRRWVEARGWP